MRSVESYPVAFTTGPAIAEFSGRGRRATRLRSPPTPAPGSRPWETRFLGADRLLVLANAAGSNACQTSTEPGRDRMSTFCDRFGLATDARSHQASLPPQVHQGTIAPHRGGM
jgi:hypothetical protein